MSDYPKATRLWNNRTDRLVIAVQDTFGGRTFRQVAGQVRIGAVLESEIDFSSEPSKATGENNMGDCNFRVAEAVHPNTVRAVLRRAGIAEKLCRGCWYRVIED